MLLSVLSCGGGEGGGSSDLNGIVTGVVSDATSGAPLGGVSIGEGAKQTLSDANGIYTLSLSDGYHTLEASVGGYEKTHRLVRVPSGASQNVDWQLTQSHRTLEKADPFGGRNYTILAWNDLGMHCTQDDFSYFLILPPFNTVHVQVIKRGIGPVTSGVTVSYEFPNKKDSSLHTNFWTSAEKYGWGAKYGWVIEKNKGITGTPLAGPMAVDADKLGFVAVGIPVTPYNDDGTWDPYGTATITVKDDLTGETVTADVVVPVSTELNCQNCHGLENPYQNILRKHDKRSGTTLVEDKENGIVHLCAECHADNALGLPGKPGVKNLSLAMHGFHKDKMNFSTSYVFPDCYNCHPGPKTQCLRGMMYHAKQTCSNCHGDINGMAKGLAGGRRPWLDEPQCGGCHGEKHQENPGTLYKNSVLNNTWNAKMSGRIYCEACHNSTHAEYTSTNAADNSIPMKFQGDNYWIWNCWVCHLDYMTSPSMHK
jgi:hypothetical protein